MALLGSGQVRHTFSFEAKKPHKSVHVAGTFNNWNKAANPLHRVGTSQTWQTSLSLPVGKHHYKFVLDGETWIVDPAAKKNEDDGNGNVNSVLFILPADYGQPATAGDDQFTKSALRHERNVPDLNFDRGRLRLSIRTRAGDIGTAEVQLGTRSVPMKRVRKDEVSESFVASIPWNGKARLAYVFALEEGANRRYLTPGGLMMTPEPRFQVDPASFDAFEVPGWVERSIFYQIFPDRFCNGSSANDPVGTVAWDTKPQNGDHVFGGDAAGVQSKLGYLKNLGVDAVYFNPIFESPVIHRYETTDYTKVDPRFGTNREFVTLTKAMKRHGMRVVLDGVFNHVAPNFPMFADILKNQQRSKYLDWFHIKSFPVAVKDPPPYEAWWGYKSMPEVNLLHKPAADYMLRVPRFWHREAQIDGWRLDVANEVPMEFWRAFRKAVKGLGEDRWIVGEVWGDGSQWLKGDQWDSVMNYPFREAVLKFVADGRTAPTQFADRLTAVYEGYAPQVSRNMMNLIGSHDTPRFRTLCKGDEKLAMMGATVLLTWIGAPSIYYGDELGMEGGPDPDNRRGMAWGSANKSNRVFTHYKSLIAARRSSKALQFGDFRFLVRNDTKRIVAYERTWNNERAVVILNRSESAQSVDLALGNAQNVLKTGKVRKITGGKSRVTLPGLTTAVFR